MAMCAESTYSSVIAPIVRHLRAFSRHRYDLT